MRFRSIVFLAILAPRFLNAEPAPPSAWQDVRNDVAIPLVVSALQKGNSDVAGDAYAMLQTHGGDAEIDPMTAWLERTASNTKNSAGSRDATRTLLADKRRHFTDNQIKRLMALVPP